MQSDIWGVKKNGCFLGISVPVSPPPLEFDPQHWNSGGLAERPGSSLQLRSLASRQYPGREWVPYSVPIFPSVIYEISVNAAVHYWWIKDVTCAPQVTANNHSTFLVSVLWRLRDYLRLLVGRTLNEIYHLTTPWIMKYGVTLGILGASEITADLYCNCVHLYWEGCVICSIELL